MKTIEEKAKAYDEAPERARKAYNAISPENYGARKIIEDAFPELRESEDEKIRRTLIEYFSLGVKPDFVRGVPIQKIRDWLEKQKEQKPADYCSVRDEFDLDGNLKQKLAGSENDEMIASLTQILEEVLGNSAIYRYGICTPAQVAAYMKTMIKTIKLMKHFNP